MSDFKTKEGRAAMRGMIGFVDCDSPILAMLDYMDEQAHAFDVLKTVDEDGLAADRAIERALGRSEGAAEADPNAAWLTAAHILCTDYGVPPGLLTDRLAALRVEIEAKDENNANLIDVQIEERDKYRAALASQGNTEPGMKCYDGTPCITGFCTEPCKRALTPPQQFTEFSAQEKS